MKTQNDPLCRREFHIFHFPLGEQFGGVRFQTVDARVSGRRGIVPLHQLRGGLGAPTFLPAFVNPIGMRMAKGGLRGFQLAQ